MKPHGSTGSLSSIACKRGVPGPHGRLWGYMAWDVLGPMGCMCIPWVCIPRMRHGAPCGVHCCSWGVIEPHGANMGPHGVHIGHTPFSECTQMLQRPARWMGIELLGICIPDSILHDSEPPKGPQQRDKLRPDSLVVGDTAMTGRPESAGTARLSRGGRKCNAIGMSREAIIIIEHLRSAPQPIRGPRGQVPLPHGRGRGCLAGSPRDSHAHRRHSFFFVAPERHSFFFAAPEKGVCPIGTPRGPIGPYVHIRLGFHGTSP